LKVNSGQSSVGRKADRRLPSCRSDLQIAIRKSRLQRWLFHQKDLLIAIWRSLLQEGGIFRLCNLPALLVAIATLQPAAGALAEPTARQFALLAANCLQCHAVPATGAPQLGVDTDWQEALARGEDGMLANVVHGIRGMPPLGYCGACSEADFRALIRLLAGGAPEAGAIP
jgi:cytochrome c5